MPRNWPPEEERLYQAFKARLLQELEEARQRKAEEEERFHDSVLNDVWGTHGQG